MKIKYAFSLIGFIACFKLFATEDPSKKTVSEKNNNTSFINVAPG